MSSPVYELFLRVHVAFGVVALAGFWWQVATRKRGLLHRRVGQLYFLAMTGVVATAVPMTALLAGDGNWGAALLLAFLAWITVSAGVGAWMAARWRGRRLPAQHRFSRVANWGLLAVSLAMVALFQVGGALFVGLGAFGAWAALADLRRPADALVWRRWQVRHVEGVMGTGMAVHIAFLSFGLRGLLGAAYDTVHFLLAFALPVALGTWAAHHFTRRWRRAGGTDGAAGAGRAADVTPPRTTTP